MSRDAASLKKLAFLCFLPKLALIDAGKAECSAAT